MEDFRCNLLIMGITGTGKSSLLNYICGTYLAETGAGKPVTGEGLYEYLATINQQEVRIFDSWGIEAGKIDRWNKLIDDSLHEHGVQKSMNEWFHSVIYCIQAGGDRVQNIDLEIINKFLSEGYHLTVVLTKADQFKESAREAKIKEFIKKLKNELDAEKRSLLKVIPTCAEENEFEDGRISTPFGKKELIEAILTGWRETIVDRLPKHVIARMGEEVDSWGAKVKNVIRNGEIEISGIESENEKILEGIGEYAKKFVQELQTELLPKILKESIESCYKANAALIKVLAVDKIDLGKLPSSIKDVIERIVKDFWKIFFVFPAVRDFFKRRSEIRRIEQRVRIEEYIDRLCEKMKKEFEKQEPTLAKTIAQSLK